MTEVNVNATNESSEIVSAMPTAGAPNAPADLDGALSKTLSVTAKVVLPVNVRPSNVPFNLIVADSKVAVQKLASHYALSDVRYMDDLHLPSGGPKRGEALNELLSGVENTVTLAIILDDTWVKELSSFEDGLSTMIWRSVESKLMGHHTVRQRNLILVGCASDGKAVTCIDPGAALPVSWKAPPTKMRDTRPAATVKGKTASKEVGVQNVSHPSKPVSKGVKPAKEQVTSSRQKANVSPNGNSKRFYDDILLLCKGWYGDLSTDVSPATMSTVSREFLVKLQMIVQHHLGTASVTNEQIVKQLFRTLTQCSNRSYWGGYNFLQATIDASAVSNFRLRDLLIEWVSLIPTRNFQGKEVVLPRVNNDLLKLFRTTELTFERRAQEKRTWVPPLALVGLQD